MLDHTGKKVAEGISPPIMITDDHKSNKVKAGLKRRRTESEVLPEPRIPSLSWIKSSLPFGVGGSNPIKTEPTPAPAIAGPSSAAALYPNTQNSFPISSSSSSTTCEMEDMKSVLKSMLSSTVMQHQHQQQQQQQQQYLYSLTNNSNNNTNNTQQPAMKRMIPNEAPLSGGVEITILGTNFRPGMTVMFGDTPATNIQYWSPNTLICILPPATQPGAVVVSFKEAPPTDKSDVMVFTYLVETDRALMELALQVVGMKMTGIVEDARKIAMRIVQGNNGNSNQADGNLLSRNVKSEP
ncbi:unnamed protein product [Mucor fragilis]